MAEPVVRINGVDVGLPGIDTMNLDEAMVLYEYSRVTLDKMDELDGLHPGVLAGMLHVAVQRLNPEMKSADVQKTIRALNLVEILSSLPTEEDEDHPKSAPASEESSTGSKPTSGGDSETSSESQDETDPPATGAPESGSSESPSIRLAG